MRSTSSEGRAGKITGPTPRRAARAERLRSVAIMAPGAEPALSGDDTAGAVDLFGLRVRCGLIHWERSDLEARCRETPGRVLVRKRGFSCGYRDLGRMLEVARFAPPGSCAVIGSELVGEVVAKGPDVEDLEIGDRVIGDYHFPDGARGGGGVPTNHASIELEILPRSNLMKIPAAMPDEVAASFTIGAQTSYAIVRRLEVRPGARILVTAGGSTTSLFTIAALRLRGAEVFVTTGGGPARAARLRELGAAEVFHVTRDRSTFFEHAGIQGVAGSIGGFDAVVDPFFDLHLAKAVTVLASGGRYITCGLLDQVPLITGPRVERRPEDLEAVMRATIVKNLILMGNCLGGTEDLSRAVDDFCAGRLPVIVDSVFGGADVGPWLHRTYADPARFGKTPFLFTP